MFKEILERLKGKKISEIKTDSGNEFSDIEVKKNTIKGGFPY